jgi:anti-sigma B factor antagonist
MVPAATGGGGEHDTMKPSKNPDPYGVESGSDKVVEVSADQTTQAAPGAFEAKVVDGAHVIAFSQTEMLDAYDIEKQGDAVYRHIKRFDAPKVVIDLGNVQHMSSAALGMLVALRTVIETKKGGQLRLANLRDDLLQIFKLTKLHKVLKIHEGVDEALASLT